MENRVLVHAMMTNAIGIMKFMGECGARFSYKGLDHIISYIENMIKDQRVTVISENHKPIAVLFFSMTDNPQYFLRKGTWDYLPHFPQGKIIYVEKLVSRGWNKLIRKQFESEVTKVHPQIEFAIWHRYAKWGDRQVTYKRRMKNVRN